MKKKALILFSGVVFLFLSACVSYWDYQPVQNVLKTKVLDIYSFARANPEDGSIIVSLHLKNTWNDGILIRGYLAQLETPENYRSPAHVSSDQRILLPGEQRIVNLKFKPANSRWIFQHTGWSGDFEPHYNLLLQGVFINSKESNLISTNILLEMPKNRYKKYLKTIAKENTLAVYSLSRPMEEIKALLAKNLTGKIKPETSSLNMKTPKVHPTQNDITIFISGSQYFISGLGVTVQLYRLGDTTSLRLMFFNNRQEEVVVNPNKILIEQNGAKIKAFLIEGKRNQSKKKLYVLRPGARLKLLMKFKLKGEAKNVLLYLTGITDKRQQSFFPFPLQYGYKNKGLTQ